MHHTHKLIDDMHLKETLHKVYMLNEQIVIVSSCTSHIPEMVKNTELNVSYNMYQIYIIYNDI